MESKATAQACASPPTAGERRSWRNIKACFWWTALFVATFLIGGRIFKYADWAPEGPLAWGLSLIPIVPGTIAFLAFLRFYREADEMIREIYAEGMVFGAGAVLVFWGAIQLPEHVWLGKVDANTIILVLLSGFCVGILRANWRRK
jgi:hypothetical protein